MEFKTRNLALRAKDLGLGTWDLGLGTWDLGLGTWDLGPLNLSRKSVILRLLLTAFYTFGNWAES